jgi:hypothetical protein
LKKAVNSDGGGEILELDDAGIKWAEFCLKNFSDDLLKRGLRISRAIADFTLELQQKEKFK